MVCPTGSCYSLLMHRAAALILLSAFAASAQSIQYSDSRKIWLLTTRQSSYAMGLGADGALRHLYWGAPLWRTDDLAAPPARQDISSFDPRQMLEAEEFPGWGGPRRSATIRNATQRTLTVESAQSATWNLPPGEGYQLTYLSGRWAAETQVNHEPIHEGQKVLESRKGHTSHNFNPWFAIDSGDAGEEHGSVWFGALGWSGNWRMSIEQTPYRQVRVTGGFNSFDFSYPLKPGESLETPPFYGGFSAAGFGPASRM